MNTSHYPSLELCKKLTEIKFSETELHWFKYEDEDITFIEKWEDDNIAICPSVMEMLDVIPNKIRINKSLLTLRLYKDSVMYKSIGSEREIKGTLPNTLAEMIIWLHQNNHIKF